MLCSLASEKHGVLNIYSTLVQICPNLLQCFETSDLKLRKANVGCLFSLYSNSNYGHTEYIPVISACRKWRQEDLEFEASLKYIVKSCLKKLRDGWLGISDRKLASMHKVLNPIPSTTEIFKNSLSFTKYWVAHRLNRKYCIWYSEQLWKHL